MLIEVFFKDDFDAAIAWVVIIEGSLAGCPESDGVILFLEPQGLPQQPERYRVKTPLKPHMDIAMGLDLGPGCRLRRVCGQWLQQGLLNGK